MCCLPTRAQGSSVAVARVVENGVFFEHSGCSLESGVYEGVLFLRVHLLMCTRLTLRRCAYRWTRPLGGRWGHYLRDPRGVHWFAQKCVWCILGNGSDSICVMPSLLALVGQPSLHSYCACMVYRVKGGGALRRNCAQILRETSFFLPWSFSV